MNAPHHVPLSFHDVRQRLGFVDVDGVLQQTWELSAPSYAPDQLGFLDPSFVRQQCTAARLSRELTEATLDTAAALEDDPALSRLAWHLHWLLFVNDEVAPTIRSWPRLPDQLGTIPPLCHLVVLLSGIPGMRQRHHELGLPESVTTECLVDFQVWADTWRRRFGDWGLFEVGWIYKSLRAELFTLGRLQFELAEFPFGHRLWRDTVTGHVLLLAQPDTPYRDDGLVDGTGDIHAERTWTADYAETDDDVTGRVIDPRGRATRKQVTLQKPRWKELLREGSPCSIFHIPATGPLAPDAWHDSFRRAVSFFAEFFPDRPVPVYVSNSWLFDEKLERLVAPQSNIAAFLRGFYLFPVKRASDRQTLERAFGYRFNTVDDCPQDTSLQRRIVELMRGGTRFNNAGALLVPELLDRGDTPYRDTVDPILEAP
ncbi:MAG: acyltransferase domain-containing protein [Planctomycetota bacterium]